MSVQEHYDKLAEGPEAWNAWRTACPNRQIDLTGATISLAGHEISNLNFSGVDLSRAVFSDIVVRHASFKNAILRDTAFGNGVILDDCDFENANFGDTSFEFCHLSNCKFHRTDGGSITGLTFLRAHCAGVFFAGRLINVTFNLAELHHANFTEVAFQDCSFVNATADHCIFMDARFTGVEFEGARLIGSDFSGTTFDAKTDLFSADLTDADFRRAHGYQFDDNRANGIILSPDATDEWSVLRRAYTGAKFGFNVIFLLLFFLPIVAKAVFWMQVAQFEHTVDRVEAGLNRAADELSLIPGPPGLNRLGERLRDLASRGSCLAGSCERVWLPAILLGIPIPFHADNWSGYFILGLTAAAAPALILYNIARGVLTYFVLPLRDEEDRCGHTPRRLWSDLRKSSDREPEGVDLRRPGRVARAYRKINASFQKLRSRYSWLVPVHKLVQSLQYVAYGLAGIHILRIFGEVVSLPT